MVEADKVSGGRTCTMQSPGCMITSEGHHLPSSHVVVVVPVGASGLGNSIGCCCRK